MLALYIIIGVITLLALCLLIPVDFTFNIKTEGDKNVSFRVNWLFGLVKRDLRKRKQTSIKRKSRMRDLLRIGQIGFDRAAFSALMKLAQRLISALKVKKLTGYLKLGFYNPADTGIAYGVIQPLFACLSLPASASFRIEPDFTEEILEAEAEGRVRVHPFRIAGIFLGFICSPGGWHTIRRLIRRRKA